MAENEKWEFEVFQNNNFEIIQDNNHNNFSAYCYECQKKTNHSVITGFRSVYINEIPPCHQFDACNVYEFIKCDGCCAISYKSIYSDSNYFDGDDEPECYVYPLVGQRLHVKRIYGLTEFPTQEMRDVYFETEMAINYGLPILAGVGLRTLLEQVCNYLISEEEKRIGKRLTQTAKGGTAKGGEEKEFIIELILISKIKWLQKRKIINSKFQTIFNNIRDIGNTSTHEAKLKENYDMASLRSGLKIIRDFVWYHYGSVNQAEESKFLINND